MLRIRSTERRLSGTLGPGGILILPFDSEFGFNFGDAGLEASLNLGYRLGLSEMACVIKVLKIRTELVQELAGKAVTHSCKFCHKRGAVVQDLMDGDCRGEG